MAVSGYLSEHSVRERKGWGFYINGNLFVKNPEFALKDFHNTRNYLSWTSFGALTISSYDNGVDISGSAGNFNVYSGKLFVDRANSRVGVNTGSPQFTLHVAGRTAFGVPNSAPTDGNLSASQCSLWVDETAHELKVRVKYADGTTLKSGTVTLS